MLRVFMNCLEGYHIILKLMGFQSSNGVEFLWYFCNFLAIFFRWILYSLISLSLSLKINLIFVFVILFHHLWLSHTYFCPFSDIFILWFISLCPFSDIFFLWFILLVISSSSGLYLFVLLTLLVSSKFGYASVHC